MSLISGPITEPAPDAVQSRGLVLNRAVVSAVVAEKLSAFLGRRPDLSLPRVLMLLGEYGASAATEFAVKVDEGLRGGEGRRVSVRVRSERSMLGMIDAVQDHLRENPDDLLVIVTDVELDLPWDVRGHALGQCVHAVDPADVVQQRFGAVEIDPRIRQRSWLLTALLEAEPSAGWPPVGALLSLDAAHEALVAERLGLDAVRRDALDVVALLEWAATVSGPARYLALPAVEREGLRSWLAAHTGPGAGAVLVLIEQGDAEDVVPLGLLASAIGEPSADVPLALLLGETVRDRVEVEALGRVVHGLLARRAAEIHGRPESSSSHELRRWLDGVVDRADALARQKGLVLGPGGPRWLPSSWAADLRALGAAIDTALAAEPVDPDAAGVPTALARMEDHRLAPLYPHRRDAARDAARVTRWLAGSPAPISSVRDAVERELADWGWVDRALTALWSADTAGDPVVGAVYGRVHDRARERRQEIDRQAAERLQAWAGHARSPHTEGALVVEDVLAKVAVPLSAAGVPPLVVVLDGMSSAVAVELAEELTGSQGWLEASPTRARAAAVSVLPSVTRLSRTSLLTGVLQSGEQGRERQGFERFWKNRHRGADLFHKGELAGAAGQRLSPAVLEAINGDGVVGVVLNTIDDALDHGRQGDHPGWSSRDITYLPGLLEEARKAARPVILVSDHGHVLERHSQDDPSTRETGGPSARWHTGASVRDGEIEVTGPRVLEGGGRVVLPWRESIRYSARHAGYHGGASLAEITVPVIVLLSARQQLPPGWEVLAPELLTPAWWSTRPPSAEPAAPVSAAPKPPKLGRRPAPDAGQGSLFAVDDEIGETEPVGVPPVVVTRSLGQLVVASEQYGLTRRLVVKPPAPADVAAVLDALAWADGTMSVTAVAAAAGRAGRNPEFLVSTLQRLLNVEGYQVLELIDGGGTVRLDAALLREQFGLDR